MPRIVISASQAIATTIPDAHQPMNSHQTNRTRRFGPRCCSTTVLMSGPPVRGAPDAEHVQDREDQEDRERETRADEPSDRGRHGVADERDERVGQPEEVVVRDRVAEVRMTAHVAEQQEPGDAGGHPDDRVGHDCGGLVLRAADAIRAGDDRGREGHDGDREEEDQVPPHQPGIDGPDPRERGVVAHPQDADVGEGRQVRHIADPLVDELLLELAAERRDRELEHEQRDRDREDPVAERLDPVALGQTRPSLVGHGASAAASSMVMMTLPRARPSSTYRRASTTWLNGKRRSIIGLTWPPAISATMVWTSSALNGFHHSRSPVHFALASEISGPTMS